MEVALHLDPEPCPDRDPPMPDGIMS